MDTALSICNLKTHFFTDAGVATAVDDVSLDIPRGKTVALVGESGCGKSVTALSVLRLVPDPPGRIVEGEIYFGGRNLLELSEREIRNIRGNGISMVFQEPMTALNPVFRVGNQIAAAIRVHRDVSKKEAMSQTVMLLDQVGIPEPAQRATEYPHQLSGGMRQRAMIAMALACGPELLIADEPTTALDVTIQAQILDLLKQLQAEHHMAVLLITHDLGIVAETADHVAIMYAGKIVEQASVTELFDNPKHPYTLGLFKSLPRLDESRGRLRTIEGRVPAATHFPSGCRFHPRCEYAMDVCREDVPPLGIGTADHGVACWLHDESVMRAQERPPGIPQTEETAP
ncbi:MAG: ABC transporter ATP-binding protein [Candidatus Hydrogenedentota bacterium]